MALRKIITLLLLPFHLLAISPNPLPHNDWMKLPYMGYAPLVTSYHFSNNGNDATGNGSIASPYRTVTKANSLSYSAGDSILFAAGYVSMGITLVPPRSSLIYSKYNAGPDPIISGSLPVTSWAFTGGNIWESVPTFGATLPNMVTISGVNTGMGRTPDAGLWFTITSHTDSTSITVPQFTGTPNYTGAQVVVRENRFVDDIYNITAQSGSVLTITGNGNGYEPTDGFKCFIQDDIRTLTTQNEWFYSTVTGKISVYSVSTPGTTLIATVDNVVNNAFSNNTFEHINFQGSNGNLISTPNVSFTTIKNCSLLFSGQSAVYCPGADDIVVRDCIIKYANRNGFESGLNTKSVFVINDTIKSIGMLPGMIGRTDNNEAMRGVWCSSGGTGDSVHIVGNKIDSIGYNAIDWQAYNINIDSNLVSNFCSTVDDGGGIYSFSGTGNTNPYVTANRLIRNNIVINGQNAGTAMGANDNLLGHTNGMYYDNEQRNYTCTGNTSANNFSGYGLLCNDNRNCIIRNNTFYGNYLFQVSFNNMQLPVSSGIEFKHNTCVTFDSLFKAGDIATQSMPAIFSAGMDSNRWCKPAPPQGDPNAPNVFYYNIYTPPSNFSGTLAGWKANTGLDIHSFGSPKTVTSPDSVRLVYNATSSPVVISLGAKWLSTDSVLYNNTITQAPWSSTALIYYAASGGNILPIVDAGPPQSITLPTNTVTLSGSASDTDGTIVGYQWTQLSGPGGATINSPTTASTTVTFTLAGNYVFTLTATDNSGGMGSDIVNVTVNASHPVNVPPVVDAGPNQTIQLPVTSSIFAGSAVDGDGTITSHTWSQTGGPSCTITTPSSYTSTVTGMVVAGTYIFQLSATDDNFATSTDAMQIIVSPAVNVPPVISAITGTTTITLPLNSITLSVTASDPDGTISSYAWSKISGTGTGNITSPGLASTTVTAMTQGTFTFRVVVTDNNGGQTTGTVNVTVNPITPVCMAESPSLYIGQCVNYQTVQVTVKKKTYYYYHYNLYNLSNQVVQSGSISYPGGTISLLKRQTGTYRLIIDNTSFIVRKI